MGRRIAIMVGCLGAIASTPAFADEQLLRMAPDSNWTAEFADNFCALRQTYSAGEHSAFLEIRKVLPTPWIKFTIVSQSLERRDRNLRAGFLPDDDLDSPAYYERVESQDGWKGFVYSGRVAADDGGVSGENSDRSLVREQAITGYIIENGFAADLLLETGPMDEVMAVMRQCVDGLVESWGLNPRQQRNLSRQVDFSSTSWFRRYIREAEEVEREFGISLLELLLLVDADGRVTRCTATNLPDEFRQSNSACEYVLENARFDPALDADGDAIESAYELVARRTRTTTFTFGS